MSYIKELVIIGNWAKSCKTKEQLDTVRKYLDKKIKSKDFKFPEKDTAKANYSLGIVDGIILTLSKTRFGESK